MCHDGCPHAEACLLQVNGGTEPATCTTACIPTHTAHRAKGSNTGSLLQLELCVTSLSCCGSVRCCTGASQAHRVRLRTHYRQLSGPVGSRAGSIKQTDGRRAGQQSRDKTVTSRKCDPRSHPTCGACVSWHIRQAWIVASRRRELGSLGEPGTARAAEARVLASGARRHMEHVGKQRQSTEPERTRASNAGQGSGHSTRHERQAEQGGAR